MIVSRSFTSFLQPLTSCHIIEYSLLHLKYCITSHIHSTPWYHASPVYHCNHSHRSMSPSLANSILKYQAVLSARVQPVTSVTRYHLTSVQPLRCSGHPCNIFSLMSRARHIWNTIKSYSTQTIWHWAALWYILNEYTSTGIVLNIAHEYPTLFTLSHAALFYIPALSVLPKPQWYLSPLRLVYRSLALDAHDLPELISSFTLQTNHSSGSSTVSACKTSASQHSSRHSQRWRRATIKMVLICNFPGDLQTGEGLILCISRLSSQRIYPHLL